MKKLCTFLLLILCCGISYAADPDWTVAGNDTWKDALPGTVSTKESTHTNQSGNTITIYNTKKITNSTYAAFFLTKKSGYVTLEQFQKPVEKIVLWAMNGGADNAKVNITDNGTALGSVTLTTSGVDKSYELVIPKEKQTAKPTIKISATNSGNAQISKIDIYFAEETLPAVSAPAIACDDANKQFTISAVDGATVYYCVNNSSTATAAECTETYSGAVAYETSAGTYYVHAYAKASDPDTNSDSKVVTASYTVTGPKKLDAPSITLDDNAKQFLIDEISGGDIYYTVNQSITATATDCTLKYSAAVPYMTDFGTYYVHAYAKATDTDNYLDSDVATVSYTVTDPSAVSVYSLVTDYTTLAIGDRLLIVYENGATKLAMGAAKTNNFGNLNVAAWASGTDDNRIITIPADATTKPTEITLEANSGNTSSSFPYLLKVADGYLSAVYNKNYLKVTEEVSGSTPFAIEAVSASDNKAKIWSTLKLGNSSENRHLQYNISANCFSCYTSNQQNCYIYKLKNSDEPVKKDAGLAWLVEDDYLMSADDMLDIADVIANPNDLPVTYTSSNPDVIDVEEDILWAMSEGTATLTASFEGNDEYNEQSISHTFRVVTDKNATTTYSLLTDPASLTPGTDFLIVGYVESSKTYYAMGAQFNATGNNANYREASEVTVEGEGDDRTITLGFTSAAAVAQLEAYGDVEGYPYVVKLSDGYLFASPKAGKNQISTASSIQNNDDSRSSMKIEQISAASQKAHFRFAKSTDTSKSYSLYFNPSATRFSGYANSSASAQEFFIFTKGTKTEDPADGNLSFEYSGNCVETIDGVNYVVNETGDLEVTMTVSGYDPDASLYMLYTTDGSEPDLNDTESDDWKNFVQLDTDRSHTFKITPKTELRVDIAQANGTSYINHTKGSFKLEYTPVMNGFSSLEDLAIFSDEDLSGYALEFDEATLHPYAVSGGNLYVADDAEERCHIKITNAPSPGAPGLNVNVTFLLCTAERDANGHLSLKHLRSIYDTENFTPVSPLETEFSSYEASAENIYKYVSFKDVYVGSEAITGAPQQQAGSMLRVGAGESLGYDDVYGISADVDPTKPITVDGYLEHNGTSYMFVPTRIGDTTVSVDSLPADGATVEGIYDLRGVKMIPGHINSGIYIVRYSDGRTAKMVLRK